jgi:hypothetical protein
LALPPKDDPRRPLHLAIRSVRLLGIGIILIGALTMIPYMLRGRVLAPSLIMLEAMISRFVCFVVPGTLLILAGICLKKRQLWALVTTLLVTGVLCIVCLFAATVMIAIMSVSPGEWRVVFPLAIFAVLGLALVQLVYYLARSFEGIRYPPFEMEERGFEPIFPAPSPLVETHGAEFSETDRK